jgi:3'-phosphoadenosine 5'-phosphosulfate sulfotransferase (PAPS reductase)/FAD synthetase
MGYCYHSKLENIQKVHPLWHWKQEEVKKYTQDNNIPMNEIYKKLKRSGCWPCTAFKGSMKVMNKANPQYAKMVSKRRGNTLIEDY